MKSFSSPWQLIVVTFQYYLRHFKEFFAIYAMSLVGAFPLVIVYIIYRYLNLNNDGSSFVILNLILGLAYFIASLVAIYFSLSAQIGCFLIVKKEHHQNPWKTILKTRKYFSHFLLLWLMLTIILTVSALPIIISFNLSLASVGLLPIALWQMGQSGLILGILLALLMIPIAYVTVIYSMSFFAFMEHGFENVSAMRRSRELVRGRFSWVLVRILAFSALWLAIYLVISSFSLLASDHWLYAVSSIAPKLILIFLNIVFLPSAVIFGQLLYQELLVGRLKSLVKTGGSQILTRATIVLVTAFLLIALLNTLAMFSSASVARAKMRARDSQRLADISLIQAKLAEYYSDQGTFPEWLVMGDTLASSEKIYLWPVPSNPKSADGDCPIDFEYQYQLTAGGHDYQLTYCLGSDLSADKSNLFLRSGSHSVGNNDLLLN